jgi:hypothetical protein
MRPWPLHRRSFHGGGGDWGRRNYAWRRGGGGLGNWHRRVFFHDWNFCHRLRHAAAPTDAGRISGGDFWLGLGSRRSRRRPTTTTRGSWRRRDACAFLALPTGADASDLIVAQWTEVATDRYIHLAKEVDHLVTGNPKFACQIVHSKLAQPYSSKS